MACMLEAGLSNMENRLNTVLTKTLALKGDGKVLNGNAEVLNVDGYTYVEGRLGGLRER